MDARLGFGLLFLCVSASAACKKEDPPPSYPQSAIQPSAGAYPVLPVAAPAPAPAWNPADPLAAMRARCVARTNEFRARVSAAPLVRRTDREACGDAQAQNDGATSRAHGAFGRCQEGAQNECPGWPGPLDQTIDNCLAQMFAEGPGPFSGHGHYTNMTDPSYRSVSCGITILPSGNIWIVQDFYR